MPKHIVTPTVIGRRKTGPPDRFFGPSLAAAVKRQGVQNV